MTARDRQRAGLALGTEVRSRRAALKRAIRREEIDLPQLLEGEADDETEQAALGMQIMALLVAIPGVGDATIVEIGKGQSFGPTQRLGELTVRQRRALADAIRKEIEE